MTTKTRLLNAMVEKKRYRQEGLTISQLAADISIAEYKLRRYINQEAGFRNFNDFLNQFRIEEVKERLQDPNYEKEKILFIATKAGFSSIGSFNRVFKRHTQMTPSQYRNQKEK